MQHNQVLESVAEDIQTTPAALNWKDVLGSEREQAYFISILDFLDSERAAGKTIYPAAKEVFNAFSFTPFSEVRVVIVGQDPYHGAGQAHGLSFSVRVGVRPPPSLENIFKELESDLGIKRPSHGCLESWAKQGVFLLNTSLSVEAGKPGSHAKIGWERFTDKVISELNLHRSGLVFLLWGAHAQRKGESIDTSRHHVLSAAHPSPFSVHRGFFGCKHFSRTNQILSAQSKVPIDWSLA